VLADVAFNIEDERDEAMLADAIFFLSPCRLPGPLDGAVRGDEVSEDAVAARRHAQHADEHAGSRCRSTHREGPHLDVGASSRDSVTPKAAS